MDKPIPEAVQRPNFMTLAKDLNANVLRCIEGVLEKHSAAILSELYDDVQRQKALTAAEQQGQAVYQIENDPDEWFDVDRAMYEGHDGSRKRILYSAAAPPSAPVGVEVDNVPCPKCGGSLTTWGCNCEPRWPMRVLAQQPAAVDEALPLSRDHVESIMQLLYSASNGSQNIFANTADELRDLLATQHQEPTT